MDNKVLRKSINSGKGAPRKRRNKGSTVRVVLLVVILILLIVLIAMLAVSCSRNKKAEIINKLVSSGASDIMLMDYYHQVVGTEDYQGYSEIVLYAIVDSETGKMSTEEVRMQIYTDGGLRTEKMEEKTVPYEAYERALEVVKDYDMPDWADKSKLTVLEGALHVCKFPWKDAYIRVSSEAMPRKGEEAFNALAAVLEEYK